jgi:hypothetical protein
MPAAVWKAFGHVFNDMNLAFSVVSVDPLTISASGDATFQAFAAGIATDRFPDQARLLVVRLIQQFLARFTDASFFQRFRVQPVLGDLSCTGSSWSLERLMGSVQASVRDTLSQAFPAHVDISRPDSLAELPDVVPQLDEAVLRKAIKYVFGARQMNWDISISRGGIASIVPCYKFVKARGDAYADNISDRARAMIVRIIDGFIDFRSNELMHAVAAGTVNKESMKWNVENILKDEWMLLSFPGHDELHWVCPHPGDDSDLAALFPF